MYAKSLSTKQQKNQKRTSAESPHNCHILVSILRHTKIKPYAHHWYGNVHCNRYVYHVLLRVEHLLSFCDVITLINVLKTRMSTLLLAILLCGSTVQCSHSHTVSYLFSHSLVTTHEFAFLRWRQTNRKWFVSALQSIKYLLKGWKLHLLRATQSLTVSQIVRLLFHSVYLFTLSKCLAYVFV